MNFSRRTLLASSTALSVAALAGCTSEKSAKDRAGESPGSTPPTEPTTGVGAGATERPDEVSGILPASTLLVLGDGRVLRLAATPDVVELVDRGAAAWAIGGAGADPGQFNGVAGAAVGPDDSFWIVDSHNRRVQVVSATGEFTRVVGAPTADVTPLRQPNAVAVAADGRAFVADAGQSAVVPFAADGTPGDVIGAPGSEHACFGITGVEVAGDELVVAEALAPRVQVYSLPGEWLRTIELPQHFTTADLVVSDDDVYLVSRDGRLVRTKLDGSTKGDQVEHLGGIGAHARGLHLAPGGVIVAAGPLPTEIVQ